MGGMIIMQPKQIIETELILSQRTAYDIAMSLKDGSMGDNEYFVPVEKVRQIIKACEQTDVIPEQGGVDDEI